MLPEDEAQTSAVTGRATEPDAFLPLSLFLHGQLQRRRGIACHGTHAVLWVSGCRQQQVLAGIMQCKRHLLPGLHGPLSLIMHFRACCHMLVWCVFQDVIIAFRDSLQNCAASFLNEQRQYVSACVRHPFDSRNRLHVGAYPQLRGIITTRSLPCTLTLYLCLHAPSAVMDMNGLGNIMVCASPTSVPL